MSERSMRNAAEPMRLVEFEMRSVQVSDEQIVDEELQPLSDIGDIVLGGCRKYPARQRERKEEKNRKAIPQRSSGGNRENGVFARRSAADQYVSTGERFPSSTERILARSSPRVSTRRSQIWESISSNLSIDQS